MSHTAGVGGGCSGVASLPVILKLCSSLCTLFSCGKNNGSVAEAELKTHPLSPFLDDCGQLTNWTHQIQLYPKQEHKVKKSGLCLMRQKSLESVRLFTQNSNICQAVKIRGAALFSAEGQTRRCGPWMSSVWVSIQPCWEQEMLWGARLGPVPEQQLLRLCTKTTARSSGGTARTAPSRQIPALSGGVRGSEAGDRGDGRADNPRRLRALQTEPLSGESRALCPAPGLPPLHLFTTHPVFFSVCFTHHRLH